MEKGVSVSHWTLPQCNVANNHLTTWQGQSQDARGCSAVVRQSANKFHGNSFPATAKYKIGKIGSVILTVE